MTAHPASGLHGADRLARDGQLNAAADAYTALIEAGVQVEPALFRRGRILRDMFRYGQAEGDFRRVLEINPQAEDALKYLGWILRDTKRIEDALGVFTKLLAIGGPANRAAARAELAQLLKSAWRFAAAARMAAPLIGSAQGSLAGKCARILQDAAAERGHARQRIGRLRANPGSQEDLLKGAEHLLKAGWPRLALRLIGRITNRDAYAKRMLTAHFFATWQVQSAAAGLAVLNAYADDVPVGHRHYAYCLAFALLQLGRAEDAVAALLAVRETDRDDAYTDLLWRACAASAAAAEAAAGAFEFPAGAAPGVTSARAYLSTRVAAGKLPVAFDAGCVGKGGVAGPARPRSIIQFWDTAPPEEIRALTGEWASVNAGWSHLLFSEETARSFIHAHFGGGFVSLFDFCHHPAMKADFFRLCYLYASGGVYLDADERCAMPADLFFAGWEDAPFVASISNEVPFYVHNWFLCSLPGHPVPRIAIDLMVAALAAARDAGARPHIWRSTGPGCLTRAVAMHCRASEAACGRMPDDLVLIGHGHFRRFAKMPDLAYKKQQSGNWRLAQ
jgi:tetratricopeptide (TPR) repeat protein